jgi:hypothetical protein
MTEAGLAVADAAHQFNTRFGSPRRASHPTPGPPSRPPSTWPGWYDSRDMIALALGAHEPRWINGAWWHDRNTHALDGVNTLADVKRIPLPNWPQTPMVQRMLAARERWHQEHPEEAPPGLGITCPIEVPGRGCLESIAYPSFVDLGVYLVGLTRFLTWLGGDPEVAEALLETFFRLSTTYVDFLFSLQPRPVEMLCGFGGDATCMLSPPLYRRYGAAWDQRLFDHFQRVYQTPENLPCNLHSCGASGHLYEEWGQHPGRENITTVQTRLLPGQVKRLRESLPYTRLELTLHPPHFDPATATPEELVAVLLESARDAGFSNLGFTLFMAVHRPEQLARAAANIQAAEQAMEEVERNGSCAYGAAAAWVA